MPAAAFAATDSTTFQVQAEVVASCVFPAATTPVDFGVLDNTLGNISQTGSITVKCTNNTAAKIGLDNGLHAVAGQRKIKDAGTNVIDYALWQDAAHTVAWANADPNRLSWTATGSNEVKTVYSVLNYNTAVPIGTYTDTVTATVEF
jgi:spore coat protein U-like protein